jgi:hypothetical protein
MITCKRIGYLVSVFSMVIFLKSLKAINVDKWSLLTYKQPSSTPLGAECVHEPPHAVRNDKVWEIQTQNTQSLRKGELCNSLLAI